jgi:O-antigen/teichoic acid export membrane protein
MPLGIFTYLGPLLTLQFTPSVALATAALLSVRTVAAIFFYRAASISESSIATFIPPNKQFIKPLISFGGWITITNIIGPLMTYMDRFFIGAIAGLSAVTYYVTPYEILVRLQMVSQAVVGVIFPAVSSAYASDMVRFNTLYVQGSRVLYWTMLPILSGVVLFGPEALVFWLGSEFNDVSVPILYWLSIGWMVNIIAQPASVILQAAGRPDLTAKGPCCGVSFLFGGFGLLA